MSSSVARFFPQSLGIATPQGSSAKSNHTVVRLEDGPSDEALVAQICKGDLDGLALLFRRYAQTICMLCYRVLRDRSEADDMVQEVFILVQRDCASFDCTKGTARFWIFQIAYRRAISRRRYLATRHFYTSLGLDEAATQLADPRTKSTVLDDAIDVGLGSGQLKGLFSELSDDQQQTLRLFFIEGYTFDEIAAKLGHTRGNVKNHYFRGLEKLRKALFGSKLPGERAV